MANAFIEDCHEFDVRANQTPVASAPPLSVLPSPVPAVNPPAVASVEQLPPAPVPDANTGTTSITASEATATLDAWFAAQNAGDFGAYQALYADPFTGIKRAGKSMWTFDRKGWLTDRKRMFKYPMTLTLGEPVVQTTAHGAIVTVQQTFRQGSFEDSGRKELMLVRTPQGIRLAREEQKSSDDMPAGIGTSVDVPAPGDPADGGVAPEAPQPTGPIDVDIIGNFEHGGGLFDVFENGKRLFHLGPNTVQIQVTPGHPRTLLIRAVTSDGLQRGFRDKTLLVDGKSKRIEFDMVEFPDCRASIADPKIPECPRQFCEFHKDDARCELD